MSPRVWFITGTSTGIGRNITELLLTKGEIVVATARKPEVLDDLKTKYPSSQFLTLKLDVDQAQEIGQAFSQAKAAFGRIDVVFNNAGWLIRGEIEATPEDHARKLFDTNFWAATNVSREAVRFFREENKPSGGLLINNSSVLGVAAIPGGGYYIASKHALEGFTKTLAQELDPDWNIKVTLLELGSFQTPGATNPRADYAHPVYATRAYKSGKHQSADPAKAVQRIYDFSLEAQPTLHFPVGKDSVALIKAEANAIGQDVAKHEAKSEGLGFESSTSEY